MFGISLISPKAHTTQRVRHAQTHTHKPVSVHTQLEGSHVYLLGLLQKEDQTVNKSWGFFFSLFFFFSKGYVRSKVSLLCMLHKFCMFATPERFGIFEADLSKVHSSVVLPWVCQNRGTAYSPALWRPLQITSRQCRPALCWRVYSPSWASSCLWLSSSPLAKERGSPSPASFRPSPVSILSFRRLSCSLHFCPH